MKTLVAEVPRETSISCNTELYNVVTLGARDYYQVSIALKDEGLLHRLITDFYTPRFLQNVTSKRWSKNLSNAVTISLYPAALLSKLLKPGRFNRSRKIFLDDLFGFLAGFLTWWGPNRAIVYSYHLVGFVRFYKLIRQKPLELVCFQVHPSPWFIRRLIASDTELFARYASIDFEEDIEGVFQSTDMHEYVEALESCSKIICASNVTRRSVEAAETKEKPSFIVPYGSRIERKVGIAPSIFFSSGKIKLLSVCLLTQRKGLHWAFFAMNNLSKEIQNKFEWIVVSSGGDPAIAKLAADNIRIIEKVSDEELGYLMRDADLFIMPSILEGFGLVYIESLSQGTPIVYTANTGAADICISGVHGFEVEPSKLDPLIEVFMKIEKNPSLLFTMRRECELLAQSYTWELFRSSIVDALINES